MKFTLLQVFLSTLIFLTACRGQTQNATKETASNFKMTVAGNAKISKAQGRFKDASIDAVMQDKAGNIWFGSNGEGIYRYDGKDFKHFTKKDGLRDSTVYAIYEDKSGLIWIGTQKGLCNYDGKKFKNVPILTPIHNPLPDNSVWSILQDRYGKLWFGTSDGVYCYEDGIFSHFPSDLRYENKEKLELRAIYHLLEDKKGNIWFATYSGDGLCRFDGKTLTRINPKEYTSIEKLIEDKDGNIWFNSAQKGICRYDGKTYSENITKEEKLGWSLMLYDSKKNQIWFTRKEAICCYDGEKITVLNAFINGLPNKDIYPIFHDKDGYNWFAAQKMLLYRYDGKIFERFSE